MEIASRRRCLHSSLFAARRQGPANRASDSHSNTLVALGREEHILQLEITARGAPEGTGLPAVIAFHEMAHEYIVRCFTGITTAAAHEKWER
jgi:hypothetical protein